MQVELEPKTLESVAPPSQPTCARCRRKGHCPASGPRASAYRFGDYVLFLERRRLEFDGEPVQLGQRAFDILATLILHAGEVVGKEALLRAVWHDLIVNEGALRVHVSSLRKALSRRPSGDPTAEWIANVPSRGYAFVGQVQRFEDRPPCMDESADADSLWSLRAAQEDAALAPTQRAAQAAHWASAAPAAHAIDASPSAARARIASDEQASTAHRHIDAQLSSPRSRCIGRTREIGEAVGALAQHRLVTVAGPGGVGKSMVALLAAEAHVLDGPDSITYCDLSFEEVWTPPAGHAAAAAEPTTATANADGAGVRDKLDQWPQCLARVGPGPHLLILDNCGHLVDEAARHVDQLLKTRPELRILVTSREALRLHGERVIRLEPLALPPSRDLSLAQALRYPAVQVLVNRALETGVPLEQLSHVGCLVDLCRMVDGLPLALEIVAAQLSRQPLMQLCAALRESVPLFMTSRRGCASRHRSLADLMAWSVDRLDRFERALLEGLSGMPDAFGMSDVLDVVQALPGNDWRDPLHAFYGLLDKSLVCFDPECEAAPYRLLRLTRAYSRSAAACAQGAAGNVPVSPPMRPTPGGLNEEAVAGAGVARAQERSRGSVPLNFALDTGNGGATVPLSGRSAAGIPAAHSLGQRGATGLLAPSLRGGNSSLAAFTKLAQDDAGTIYGLPEGSGRIRAGPAAPFRRRQAADDRWTGGVGSALVAGAAGHAGRDAAAGGAHPRAGTDLLRRADRGDVRGAVDWLCRELADCHGADH